MPAARKGRCEVEDLPLEDDQTADAAFAEFDANWEQGELRRSSMYHASLRRRPALPCQRAAPKLRAACSSGGARG